MHGIGIVILLDESFKQIQELKNSRLRLTGKNELSEAISGSCQLVRAKASETPIGRSLGSDFKRVIRPKLEGISASVAMGMGVQLMATSAEYEVDLIVIGQEPLCLPVRPEPAEYFLSFSSSAMRNFDHIIQTFVRPVICVFGQGLDRLDVAAKPICHNNPGRTELIDQFLQKSLNRIRNFFNSAKLQEIFRQRSAAQ